MSEATKIMDEPILNEQTIKRSLIMRFLPLIIIGAGLSFAYLMGWQRFFTLDFLAESRESLRLYVDDNPLLSGLYFVGLYTLAVAFSFPAASILTIFGGFMFGWFLGGLYVAFAATLGASAIFLATKTALGDFLKDKVGGRVEKLAKGFEDNAFSYLLVLRLAPIFPFFVMNIAPALFNVPLRSYVVATFLGILPGTFAYAYLGQGIDSVIVSAQNAGRSVQISDIVTPEITLAFAGLAAVAILPIIIKKIKPAR